MIESTNVTAFAISMSSLTWKFAQLEKIKKRKKMANLSMWQQYVIFVHNENENVWTWKHVLTRLWMSKNWIKSIFIRLLNDFCASPNPQA